MLSNTPNRAGKGFTLIEILIVVIILGILAAIVIPQFTNASKEAKQSALVTMVQSLRSQIALYKLQHNDNLPNIVGNAADNSHWNQLVQFSDVDGGVSPTKTATHVYGPYMQSVPKNPLVPAANASVVVNGVAADATNPGFVYDYAANAGSGKIWGMDGATPAALVEQ